MHHARLTASLAAATLVLAACGDDDESPATQPPTEESMTADSMTVDSMTEESMTEESMTEESMTETSMTDTSMTEATPDGLAAWQQLEITDVAGETFTLADYVGRPVLVETFATWCSNCLAQLGDTQQAAAGLGDGAAVVALSVETDIAPDTVAQYATDNGFDDIRFAVMSPEMLAGLAEQYGTTVANPPSTPKVIIDAAGVAGGLTTGAESADDLVTDVQAAA